MEEKTIANQLEDIAGEICNNYCKYPDQWDEDKEGMDISESEYCQKCPLNMLV